MAKSGNIFKSAINKYKQIPVVARAGLWFVACTMLQKCIGFITVPIFTRLMPTEEYGIYSTYLSWYSILSVFCTLNMHSVKYVNDYTKADTIQEKNNAAIPLLSLSFVSTVAVFMIYLLFHNSLDSIIGMPFVMVCLLFAQILFEPPVNFWTAQQRFEYKYVILVIRTLLMVVLNSALGIALVWIAKENHAVYRAISVVVVQFVFGGIFYVYFWKRAGSIFSIKNWKNTLRVQLPLLPHSLSLIILSSSDRLMISNMVGNAQAGIYSVAYSAGYVVNVLKNSIVDALKPWLYKKIKINDFESIRKTVNVVMILVTMVSVVFTAFAPEIIYIMAPSQYHEAIYVIPPVAASSYFTFLYNMFSIVGLYYEKTNRIMIASITGASLNLILNFIFIPIFGYVAAAYTTLVCYIFFSFAHYIIMRAICKDNLNDVQIYDIKFIIGLSLLVILFTILFSFAYQYAVIRYCIIFVILVIIYIKRKMFIGVLNELKGSKKRKGEIVQ